MTEDEKALVYRLAQKLTGAHPEGTYQIGIFLTNVERRMREIGTGKLSDYLEHAIENPDEHSQLLSALTIHTTSWFRENPHYVILQKVLLAREPDTPFQMWSCASSTGEEVYSFALLFEEFRRFHPEFEYRILGTDIDPISLDTAKKAIYEQKYLTGPISYYKKHVLLGSEQTTGLFTFSQDVRKRCMFKAHDIRIPLNSETKFDLIVCRNVLIYFQAKEVEALIHQLLKSLAPGGHLILGHSEMIEHAKFGLTLKGHAVYEKTVSRSPPLNVEVTSPSISLADRDALLNMEPPNRGKKIRAYEAPRILREPQAGFNPKVIMIGASTGGPHALAETLWSLPPDCPPIVIAQHISSRFARTFAERLSEVTGLKIGGVEDQEILLRGHIYSAEAGHHIGVQKAGSYHLRINDAGRPWNGHKPSVDFLFRSGRTFAKECVAILLSGMGRDGAAEMQWLHDHGAYTMAQSEQDCVVFGMPREAIQNNAVDFIGTAEQIHEMIFRITGELPPT
jgi:chemotaxis response regulator CheB/chemotaxis methyl-accepting protein methylase